VAPKITDAEYSALAELRFRIRMFLHEGDVEARKAGLGPQQYLMLLAIRGIPPGTAPTIRVLAERLAVKHHSAVELIDRLEMQGLARRIRNRDDRRIVSVTLLPRGEKLLEDVALHRIGELRSTGHALMETIGALLQQKPKTKTRKRARTLRKKEKCTVASKN
jgi:DNA-binding MarR family transcriptional regulator